MNNNLERLPLTDDYIFKRVFAYKGNESVLKDFLEALLKMIFIKMEYLNLLLYLLIMKQEKIMLIFNF